MISESTTISRLILVRLESGEDVLASLEAAAHEHSIRHGAILSGAGSIRSYSVHVVETTNLPPGNIYFSGEGAFDVLTLTGMILDGRVHAHITFSDREKAMGGHIHEGCKILTFGFAVIAETPEVDLTDWDSFQS